MTFIKIHTHPHTYTCGQQVRALSTCKSFCPAAYVSYTCCCAPYFFLSFFLTCLHFPQSRQVFLEEKWDTKVLCKCVKLIHTRTHTYTLPYTHESVAAVSSSANFCVYKIYVIIALGQVQSEIKMEFMPLYTLFPRKLINHTPTHTRTHTLT